MKAFQRFFLQVVISFLVPPILFTGCSLIGFGIGAISDSGKAGGEWVSGLAELRAVERGAGIVLITRSGGRIEGDFAGMDELNRRDYDRLYLDAIETLKVEGNVPLPGDTISFNHYDVPGKKVSGLFRGLNPGSLVLWQNKGEYSLVGLRNLEGKGARPLDLSCLRRFAEDGRFPCVTTGVLVRRSHDTISVPTEDIARIERDTGGNGKLTGFAIGAAVDVVVLAIAASSDESCHHDHVEYVNSPGCASHRN
jgi:hypothetical protein